jgi:hypothetical protein
MHGFVADEANGGRRVKYRPVSRARESRSNQTALIADKDEEDVA